jgi:hypothetical protein
MKTTRFTILTIITLVSSCVSAQVLSNLHALKSDPLYTTYAAPLTRSNYLQDQGYQFQWFDNESGVEFVSNDGPNLGIAFQSGGRMIFRLQDLYREPVIVTSYSDLVKYCYYPIKNLRVEVFFVVYSSETAVMNYRFVNEGHYPVTFDALPYFYLPSADSLLQIDHLSDIDGYSFDLTRKRDGWMKEHKIPLTEKFTGIWTQSGFSVQSAMAFVQGNSSDSPVGGDSSKELIKSFKQLKPNSPFVQGMVFNRAFTLQPSDATSFRVAIHLKVKDTVMDEKALMVPLIVDLQSLVAEDELIYKNIPVLTGLDKDQELLYWSSFSLMRQCMMPAEGECRQNYYVFSREPRWGWGYGGQVFHESLAMMAYAYMDPEGAMNSQRVFMDRQQPSGYINYRTGPYLNERIETNGKPTSSAPWFNYENLEIFKVTRNRSFLESAYTSGKRFYDYYVTTRDSNNNGLCEWGAHAELESVRDARVAVWDKVGWASNFEGPDVNSMLVKEAMSLAEMAKILGKHDDQKKWLNDAMKRSELINKTMWDPASAFYYNVTKTDHSFGFRMPDDLKIKEIIGFLPLWAGVADSIQAAALVAKMQDPAEFWRPFGVPSLTAASDYYCPIGYWNGPVWVQWEYLLYRGLRDYGYVRVADELAKRVLENMIHHLKHDHVFWEFYSADDHQAGWNKTYIWAGIATRFLLDSHGRR